MLLFTGSVCVQVIEMLLFIGSVCVQVIAVLVALSSALYYFVPLGWIAAFLRFAYRTCLGKGYSTLVTVANRMEDGSFIP